MRRIAGLATIVLLAAQVVFAVDELSEMEAIASNATQQQKESGRDGTLLARLAEKLGGPPETALVSANQPVSFLSGAFKVRVHVSHYLFRRLGAEQIGICYDLEGKGFAMTDVPREWGKPFRVETGMNGHLRFFYHRPFPPPASEQAVVSFNRVTQTIDSLIFIFWLRV